MDEPAAVDSKYYGQRTEVGCYEICDGKLYGFVQQILEGKESGKWVPVLGLKTR